MEQALEEKNNKAWRYDGSWSKIPFPFDWEDDEEHYAALDRAGFVAADKWGLSGAIEIAEHRLDERWIIALSVDASSIHTVEVVGLPNLLELLPKYAAIATASVLSRTTETLQSLVYNAGEDADRERRARHQRRRR